MVGSGSRTGKSFSRCRRTRPPRTSAVSVYLSSTMRDSASAILRLVLAAAATACSDATGPTQAAQPIITAGRAHTCLLARTGAVSCWGNNASGELGNGSTVNSTRPVPVSTGIVFNTIAAGGFFTCGLDPVGAAYCWGSYIGLGNGTTSNSSVPTPVSGGLRFSRRAPGFSHVCGLTLSGAAYCWGANDAGQLGTGDTLHSFVPIAVAGGLSFSTVTAGNFHSCGITEAGPAYCWGMNGAGQLGNGAPPNPSYVPLAVSGGLNFAAIAAAASHTCALIASEAAYCWGPNGQPSGDASTPGPVVGPVPSFAR